MKDIFQRLSEIERKREARIRRMDHPWLDYGDYCEFCGLILNPTSYDKECCCCEDRYGEEE